MRVERFQRPRRRRRTTAVWTRCVTIVVPRSVAGGQEPAAEPYGLAPVALSEHERVHGRLRARLRHERRREVAWDVLGEAEVLLERHSHQRVVRHLIAAIRRERPAEQQLKRGRARGVHGDAHAEERAGERRRARGSPRDAIASAQFTLGSSERISFNVSFRNTIGRDFFIRRPSSTTEKTASHLRGAHEEPREPPRRRDDASSDTPPAARAARAARAAPRESSPPARLAHQQLPARAGRGRTGGGVHARPCTAPAAGFVRARVAGVRHERGRE